MLLAVRVRVGAGASAPRAGLSGAYPRDAAAAAAGAGVGFLLSHGHFLSVVTSPAYPGRRSLRARAYARAREYITCITSAGQRACDDGRAGGGKSHWPSSGR